MANVAEEVREITAWLPKGRRLIVGCGLQSSSLRKGSYYTAPIQLLVQLCIQLRKEAPSNRESAPIPCGGGARGPQVLRDGPLLTRQPEHELVRDPTRVHVLLLYVPHQRALKIA